MRFEKIRKHYGDWRIKSVFSNNFKADQMFFFEQIHSRGLFFEEKFIWIKSYFACISVRWQRECTNFHWIKSSTPCMSAHSRYSSSKIFRENSKPLQYDFLFTKISSYVQWFYNFEFKIIYEKRREDSSRIIAYYMINKRQTFLMAIFFSNIVPFLHSVCHFF